MSQLLTCSLNSGSNGNCIYVEKGRTRLLFDAGISGVEAARRLAGHGREIRDVAAIIVSHDHSDHSSGVGVFQRKFGLPVCITRPTFERIAPRVGKTPDVRFFRAGERLVFDDLQVETIRTPHDGVDGVVFVVTDGEQRVGILTDLGHPFDELRRAMSDVDFLYMESNYDPEMLQYGGYPEFLKRRIRGDGGHLSNEESALLVRECCTDRLKTLVLAHLSENNNDPDIALTVHRSMMSKNSFRLTVASRYEPTDMFRLA